MATDTLLGYVELFDDFLFDQIGTAAGNGIAWFNSSDTGDTAFDVGARVGGTARAATTTTDDNLVELSGANLMWRVQDGWMWMESRVSVDVITNVALNIGFNDDALDDSNTLPVELSTTNFTSNAATYIGWVFDVDATNDDWHTFFVDDDGDTTIPIAALRASGAVPVGDNTVFHTYRVEMTDRGSGNQARADLYYFQPTAQYFKGASVNSGFNSTIDRDVLMTPYTGMENRSGTAHTIDVDYIKVRAARP